MADDKLIVVWHFNPAGDKEGDVLLSDMPEGWYIVNQMPNFWHGPHADKATAERYWEERYEGERIVYLGANHVETKTLLAQSQHVCSCCQTV